MKARINGMKTIMNAVPVALLALLPPVLGSCRSTASKFEHRQRADVGSFSEQTIALLGEYNAPFTELELIRLRGLTEASAPEETRLKELTVSAGKWKLFVIELSLGLARIPQNAPESEQIAYFADLMDKLAQRLEEQGALSEVGQQALTSVRQQEDLWVAMGASMPLIQAMMKLGMETLGEIDQALQDVATKLEMKIDSRHADTLRRAGKIEDHREELLSALEATWSARRRDGKAMESLWANETVEIVGGIGEEDPDLDGLARRLIERFDWVLRVENAMQSGLDEYHADHAELDRIQGLVRERLNRARVRLLVWMTAYSRMVSGVVEPAEWFDISNTPALLMGVGTKAL